jgi:hypothetical protein
MSTGITVLIIVVVVIVVAAAAGVIYDMRRRRLRQRFGPEYDRLVEEKGSRTKAEAELVGREKRVKGLDIRPLKPEAQARYTQDWAVIQERFVDAPQEAVADGQRLVMTVMNERGYPTEGSDQVLADLSVEHASVLDHYRAAYDISQTAADGRASTEDLRQAMIHYRSLFRDLLGVDAETGTGTESAPAEVTPGLPANDPAVRDDTVAADTAVADGTVAPIDTTVPADETVPDDTPVSGDPAVPADTAVPDDTAVPAEPVSRFEAPDDVDAANGAYPADRADPVAADDLDAEPADDLDAEREAEPAATASDLPRQRRS